jgi:hypothetical protein
MFNIDDTALRGGTVCLSKAGLGEGTNATTIKIAAPNGAGVDFAIDGVLYHKADADNIDPTACDEQADETTCLYLVTLNASGTVDTVKGTEVDSDELSAGNVVLHWPAPAADTCPIGAIKVATDGAAFTMATTDLGAATVTDTYYDLLAVPVAPLTS